MASVVTGDLNNGTSLVLTVPDESAEYAFTTPVPAGAAVVALASTNAPSSTPAGWTLTPGGYFAYDPVTKNVFSAGNVVLRFYIGPPGDGSATVTFNFGSTTDAAALAFGTPAGLLDPAGGPDGSVRTVQADPTEPFGWTLDHDFTMRGTAAFGIVFSGSGPSPGPQLSGNNFEHIGQNLGPTGPIVNMTIALFASIDGFSGEPWPTGTDIDVRIEGSDDPDDLTYLFIFEFGAPGGWWINRISMT